MFPRNRSNHLIDIHPSPLEAESTGRFVRVHSDGPEFVLAKAGSSE